MSGVLSFLRGPLVLLVLGVFACSVSWSLALSLLSWLSLFSGVFGCLVLVGVLVSLVFLALLMV